MKISHDPGQVHHHLLPVVILVCLLTSQQNTGIAQVQDSLLSTHSLKKLSLEELMNIEVISVSKRPEKLNEVASAIQVITQQDIRNSGAKTLTEALRLATNLQVAQANSSQWAISARGFNNVLANKILVLIDGRTVYTPLYAGVFWDVQNLLLEDVDRIEVISGPGGTLWGTNAVNGVINIITRSSEETKGLFAELATGSNIPVLGSLRYGGKLKDKVTYRIFGTGFKMGPVVDTNGRKAKDDWYMLNGGFRLDWIPSKKDKITFQGTVYGGKPNPDGGDTSVSSRGDFVIGRWNHSISNKTDFQLQAYYDHTWRDFGNGFTEDLKTYDLEWQSRHQLGKSHVLNYGLGFRLMEHNVTNLELFAFEPAHKTLSLYHIYAQDEIMLIKERLKFTIGAKLEHNSYTGFEFQPNGRLTWTPTHDQTIWTAVSRAVRLPARIDRDFYLHLLPGLPLISGSDDFIAEKMISYELGWRSRLAKTLSTSLAIFYNVYDDLRSAEPGPPPFYIPITFHNGVKGNTYGIEFSTTYQPVSWWTLRGGYTFVRKNLDVKSDSRDLNGGTAETNDPEHQVLIQSNIELPHGLAIGTVLRHIGKLPKPAVSAYTGLDLRLGWALNKFIELNITGQNLLNKRHLEFSPSSPARREIQRSIYGKLICRF